MTDSNTKEQRKHPRHQVELGAFAVFSKDGNIIPGQVVDISMGGIAFYYFDGEDWSNEPSDVFNLFGDGFHLDNVLLELVSDLTIVEEDHPIYKVMGQIPPGSKKIHRRSVKFENLSTEQKSQLENFIKTNDIVHR